MKPENWQKIKEVVSVASELPPAERAAFLEEECGEDTEMREELESLLAANPAMIALIEDSPMKVLRETRRKNFEDYQLGGYRVVRELGRGGMGVVYLARRADDEFERQVAIKILAPGMATDELHRLFRQEIQILSNLDHQYIAKLYDGGKSGDGRRYFLMEYINGEPITKYCDQNQLNVQQRLELFRKICSAVQFAHQNLVVHRDLKPTNILVTAHQTPKLLDFGIAKILSKESTSPLTATGDGLGLMTPEYASPEQAKGMPITTASDVYSLGMILYELLTGHHPYRIQSHPESDIRKLICEEIPEKPSNVIGRVVEIRESEEATKALRPETISQTRRTNPNKLRRSLVGDLDTILLTALRKEPGHRYSSAEQFSEDIRRHLASEPILAQKATIIYRSTRFIRRHRLGVAVGVIFGLIVVSFVIALLHQVEQARNEARVAREVGNFLVNVFEASDPGETRGQTVTAREILDAGTLRLEAEKEFEPMVRGRLLDAVGRIYFNLGLYDRAEAALRLGLETRRTARGQQHLEVAESLTSLAILHRERHELERAEDLLRQALRIRRESPQSDPRTLADTIEDLGGVYLRAGRLAEAQDWFQQALELRQKELLARDPDLAKSWNNLGSVYQDQGLYSQAEEFYRQAIELWEEAYGPAHPYFIDTLNNLASLYRSQGRPEEAEKLHRQAIRRNEEVYGSTHPSLATSCNNLANLLRDQGKYDEADALYQRALAIWTDAFGPEHPDVGTACNNRAELLRSRGELDEAEELYRRACEIWRKTSGPKSSRMAICYHNLGLVATMRGDFRQAEQLSQQSCDLTKELLGDDHPELGICLQNLARLYSQQEKEPERQESLYRRALSIFERSFDRPHGNIAIVEASLANLFRDQQRFDEAEPLYRSALDTFSQLNLAPYHAKAVEYFRAFLLKRGSRADLEEAARLAATAD